MKEKWIRPLFLLAAVYDGLLGIACIIAPTSIFAMYGVAPPNHMAYVQFPAMLLIVFAIMFYRIAADPRRNRELILHGDSKLVKGSLIVRGAHRHNRFPL